MPRAERVATQTADHGAVPLLRGRRAAVRHDGALQTVTARLSLTRASLQRLLALTGSYTDFVLSAADGSTAVKVGVQIASVPDSAISLGGGVELDWATTTISRGFNRASLTRTELRLLAVLAESAPATVSYATLSRRLALGGRRKGGEGALAVVVCALRKRFIAVGMPAAIHTARGVGYSLRL